MIQLGFVVADLEAALQEFTTAFGAGPWFLSPPDSAIATDAVYRGSPVTVQAQVALAFAGELMIELIRPDPDSRSVFTEGTPERRDGLHHFGFAVDDFDARAAELGAAGRQVVFTARTLRGSRLAMVESALAGSGYEEIIELIPRTRHFYDFMRLQALTWDRAELVYSGDVPSFD